MKKLSIFFAALAMSAMAFAGPKVTMLFNDTTKWGIPTSYEKGENSYTQDGITITINAGNGVRYNTFSKENITLLMGKQGAYIQFPAFDFNVKSIKVYGVTSASGKVTYNIFAGENAVSTEVTSCLVDHEMEIAADKQAAGTIYRLKITNDNNFQTNRIEIYEAVAGAPEAPTFSVEEGVYTEPFIVRLTCETKDVEIFYSFNNEQWYPYTTPLNVVGSTTIYAKSVKNELESLVKSATYELISLDGEGTKENPFTVADVIKLKNPGTEAWVEGYILGNAKTGGAIDAVGEKGYAATNILLGSTAEDEKGVPVQLQNESDVQAALSLASHPELIGKKVKVYGELVAYFSVTGVKSTSDYELASIPSSLKETMAAKSVNKVIMNGQMYILRDGKLFNIAGQEVK